MMGSTFEQDYYDPATGLKMASAPEPMGATFEERFPADTFAQRFPRTDWGRPFANQSFGELKPADVLPSQEAKWAMQNALVSSGAAPYNAGRMADIAEMGLNFTPYGTAMSIADLKHNVERGNYGSAALDVFGALPGVGPAVKMARQLGPVGRAALGAGIAGGALLASDTAEAGPLDKIGKAARGAKVAGAVERSAAPLTEDALKASVSQRVAPGIGGPSYLSPEDQLLFAQRYPEAGAFTNELKDKPKTPGETYRAKDWTDEETRLAAAREKVMADMKAQGYQPYFDPSQRFDVDYNQYVRLFGQPADTASITKKIMKGEPPQLNMDALDEAYRRGASLGQGPFGFYKMGQLEKEFIDHYGPDEGRRQFVNRFSTPMAATTAGVTPTQNFLISQYGNFEREAGRALPDASYNVPYPVGGGKRGPMTNIQQYTKMLYPDASGATAGITYDVNPKRYDFDWAFRGRRDRPVIDEQMMGGMGAKEAGAEAAKGGYGYYARPVIERAQAMGVDPIQYQEVGWAGLKNKTDIATAIKKGATQEQAAARAFQGKPMIADVNDAIERTSRLLQIPPAEVVRRGLVQSKLPVYALPLGLGLSAVAGMGSTVAPDRYGEGSL